MPTLPKAALTLQSGETVSLNFENSAFVCHCRHLAPPAHESELRAKMDEWQTVFQTVSTPSRLHPLTAQDVAPSILMGPTLTSQRYLNKLIPSLITTIPPMLATAYLIFTKSGFRPNSLAVYWCELYAGHKRA